MCGLRRNGVIILSILLVLACSVALVWERNTFASTFGILWPTSPISPMSPISPILHGTDVSGDISTDTTWTKGNSPYTVIGDVTLLPGYTLTIEPGVEVRFSACSGLNIRGMLIAEGTQEEQIVFTAEEKPDRPFEVRVDNDYCRGCPNDGHKWGKDAFAAIQDGIDAVTCPGTVRVAAGTYYENITLKDKVQVLGAGADVTTIDGSGNGSVVTAHNVGSETVLDGFTITNGRAERGGGILCMNASLTIKNNRIIDNHTIQSYSHGGGIYLADGSNANIVNNMIKNNSANNSGGGIYFEFSSPTIDSNLIVNNAGGLEWPDGQGGGIAGYGNSIPIISNNLIINNSAVTLQPGEPEVGGGGIALDNHANPIIINNTIAGNSTVYGYGGGIFCDYSASPLILNNIIADSPDGEGIWTSSVRANPTIDYNNLWNNADGNYGGTAGSGPSDISVEPMFADPVGGDYHLQAGSLCIDTGTNDGAPSEDIEGISRPIDGNEDGTSIVDIGAYEYIPD